MKKKAPRVYSNLAISLDGKIADPLNPKKMLGSVHDKAMMESLRRQADVIVMGASTMRVLKKAIGTKKKSLLRPGLQPSNVIVTQSGDLDPAWPFWETKECIRFVFCPAKILSKVQEIVQDRAFVIAAGADRVSCTEIVKRLKDSGFRSILVEGGGELVASFLAERLLQEVYVTLTPRILGGRKSPTLVGGESCLNPWADLKLLKQKRIKSELFLHYQVIGAQYA